MSVEDSAGRHVDTSDRETGNDVVTVSDGWVARATHWVVNYPRSRKVWEDVL